MIVGVWPQGAVLREKDDEKRARDRLAIDRRRCESWLRSVSYLGLVFRRTPALEI